MVTGEMVEELILSGADIIKVGIGPGTVYSANNAMGVLIFCGFRVSMHYPQEDRCRLSTT